MTNKELQEILMKLPNELEVRHEDKWHDPNLKHVKKFAIIGDTINLQEYILIA